MATRERADDTSSCDECFGGARNTARDGVGLDSVVRVGIDEVDGDVVVLLDAVLIDAGNASELD